MLNTDAHSRQIKVRMTKQGFIANNRGINDGQDLPEEFLVSIYDDIVNNEIRMKDEIEAPTVITPGPGIAGVLATVGRDLQKEQYMLQSNNMANKTEVRIILSYHTLGVRLTLRVGSIPYTHAFTTEEREGERPVLQRVALHPCPSNVRGRLDSFPRRSLWPPAGY